ncbi:MAG: deoxynucleoside kinase [Anaerolineales bacterium]|nr:deoxynucleoside kinase [Anaerolineales bacterium]
MEKFVAVAGNIGVGKTTLVQKLCDNLGWTPFFEPERENPYLPDFYQDMQTWAFHSQVFFLTRRLRAHKNLCAHPGSVIQDRSVYEDAEIFAHNLYQQQQMGERDYQTYQELYQVLVEFLPPPDLVLYIKASVPTLQQRIKQRGRDYEEKIDPRYLNQLNILYDKWIDNLDICPVLTVPGDDLDFVANNGHLDLIIKKVEEKLTGKEIVVFTESEIKDK